MREDLYTPLDLLKYIGVLKRRYMEIRSDYRDDVITRVVDVDVEDARVAEMRLIKRLMKTLGARLD